MGSNVILGALALVAGGLLWLSTDARRRLSVVRSQRDRLLADRDRVESYLELIGALVVVLDPTGSIIRLNPAALEMLDVELDSVKGNDWFEMFVSEERRDDVRAGFSALISGGQGDKGYAEYAVTLPDGAERHTIWYRRLLRDERGQVTGVLSAGFDATERRRFEEQLATLAMQDELTGLYNRRGFIEVAEHHMHLADRTGRQGYVFYMDVDSLKDVNDRYGHRAGDWALRCVAGDLLSLFRASDIIGRIGGDEFAALALVSDESDLASLLERLEGRQATACHFEAVSFSLSLSMGVALVVAGDEALDRALAEADHTMYAQKADRSAAG